MYALAFMSMCCSFCLCSVTNTLQERAQVQDTWRLCKIWNLIVNQKQAVVIPDRAKCRAFKQQRSHEKIQAKQQKHKNWEIIAGKAWVRKQDYKTNKKMRGGCIVYMLRNSVTGAYNKPAITAFLRIPTHVSLHNEGREEQRVIIIWESHL